MTTHTAQPRPPESIAINYVGDVAELSTALTNATPSGMPFAFTVEAVGGDARIVLTYNDATMGVDVHATDWVVIPTEGINAPVLPDVMTDTAMRDAYLIDAQRITGG